MIVVLTFMVGLGFGTIQAARRAPTLRNPVRTLCLIEAALVLVTLAIAVVLSLDLAESIYGVQRFAVALGVPLSAIYLVSSAAVLLVPCVLMGLTVPIAAEAAQRQFGARRGSFVVRLFVVNTLGAVLGGLASSFYLLPRYGQFATLLVAVSANVVAAALLLRALRAASEEVAELPQPAPARGPLTPDEILGFWFGLLSLSYEIYLFRTMALQFEPLPFNFAIVVVGFLVCWSLGLLIATSVPGGVTALLAVTALVVALVPPLLPFSMFLPPILFGVAFGQVVARSARHWGRDVGRFYAINTLGSALGIVIATYAGYEVHPSYTPVAIAIGYIVLAAYHRRVSPAAPEGSPRLIRAGLVAAGAVIVGVTAPQFRADLRPAPPPGFDPTSPTAYFGRSGTVDVLPDGAVQMDGLWHSSLSRNTDHVGSGNWLMAAIPFIAHGGDIDDALVVGLGTGITAVTLARSERVTSVHAYETNRTLARVFRDFPDGTLHVASNPKVTIFWQDGRSGLALGDTRYDLITSAPMYLKQAGSSSLLSREYLTLVRQRLKPGGIFALYSNGLGINAQALLVRQTVAEIFPVYESFAGGYLILAANEPFSYDVDRIESWPADDQFVSEMRTYGIEALKDQLDRPRLAWDGCAVSITDDRPAVEYPAIASRVCGSQ